MARLDFTQEFDRPPDVVFRFLGTEHLRNHPRWDPEMHLEQITPGPIGVGTRIRRRREWGNATIEGEMEVLEFEPGRGMTMLLRDGPMELRSGWVLEPSRAGTRLRGFVEGDDTLPIDDMRAPIERSMDNMKRLIESET